MSPYSQESTQCKEGDVIAVADIAMWADVESRRCSSPSDGREKVSGNLAGHVLVDVVRGSFSVGVDDDEECLDKSHFEDGGGMSHGEHRERVAGRQFLQEKIRQHSILHHMEEAAKEESRRKAVCGALDAHTSAVAPVKSGAQNSPDRIDGYGRCAASHEPLSKTGQHAVGVHGAGALSMVDGQEEAARRPQGFRHAYLKKIYWADAQSQQSCAAGSAAESAADSVVCLSGDQKFSRYVPSVRSHRSKAVTQAVQLKTADVSKSAQINLECPRCVISRNGSDSMSLFEDL